MLIRYRSLRTIVPLTLVAALAVGAGWAALANANTAIVRQQGPAEPDKDTFAQRTRATQDDASARLESRLAVLKERLKITPEQSALWDGYADTMRKSLQSRNVENRVSAQGAPPSPAPNVARPNLVDQLDMRRKSMEAATERMAEAEDATKVLYSGLSDEQKRIADRLLAPRTTARFGLRARRAPDKQYDGTRPL